MTNKQIFSRLLIEFILYIFLSVLLIVLYETHIFSTGTLIGHASTIYIIECAGILLTMALIPLALKSYHLALVRIAISDTSEEERRQSYIRWNEIRLAIFTVIVLLNTSIYYMTRDNICGYCAIMGAIASLFCWPTKDGVKTELEMHSEEGGSNVGAGQE